MTDLGCLAFTRKHGQAFWVGETTKITSYMTPKRSEVRLEILDRGTLSPRLLRQGEQLLLRDDVMIEVITDHKRGAHVKFKIIAPKALRVQRAELREKDLHSPDRPAVPGTSSHNPSQ